MAKARSPKLTALLFILGCHAQASLLSNAPSPGLAITIYETADQTRTLVDDRRWVEVSGATVTLDHVDARAELDSLVVEPTGAVHIGACTRDELPGDPPRFVPAVRCRVTAAPGRYFVRVAYFTPAFRFDAQHDVDAAGPRAVVHSRYTLATPAWHERADVRLLAGLPGDAHPPRELARGAIVLDGSVAVLATPAREVPVELRRVVAVSSDDDDDPTGHRDDPVDVWTKLALPGVALAPGPVRAHVVLPGELARDADTRADGTAELSLWPDRSLRALREHGFAPVPGASLAERFTYSIANTGEVPRDVWIDEPLRGDRHARLVRVVGKPAVAGRSVRAHLVLAPGELGHVAFTVAYDE